MGDLVTLRPVTEDDLAFLASLRDGPAATGVHEWHGWSDPQRRRRQWAETGLLGENGGTLIVRHDADRVGHVSWRKVITGPAASGWALGVGLALSSRFRHVMPACCHGLWTVPMRQASRFRVPGRQYRTRPRPLLSPPRRE